MPLITCEMRWMLDGALPADVEDWFQRGGEGIAEGWREDRYLILPGAADMGIKQREGSLEIKGRLAALGCQAVTPGIEADAERWCKWSYDAALATRFDGLAGDRAMVVGKGRVQKHFLLEQGGRTSQVAQRAPGQRGFAIELTRIRVVDADHWSLGIEAGPDDAGLLDDLVGALAGALAGFPWPLPRARSRSYPQWLAERC